MTGTIKLSLWCPPMLIVAVAPRVRKAAREATIPTLTFEDGSQLVFAPAVIPETLVDKIGVGHWRVRACRGSCIPRDGEFFAIDLPPEDVFIRYDHDEGNIAAFAQPIDCLTEWVLQDGRRYKGITHFGICEADFLSLTTSEAEAITALGTLELQS